MKIFTIFLILISLSFNTLAKDFEIITDTNMRAFLILYPKYKRIQDTYGKITDFKNPVSIMKNYEKNIKDLLGPRKITHQEFSKFMQKAMVGLSVVKAQSGNAPKRIGDFKSALGLSKEELDIIKKYQARLNREFKNY